MSQHLSLTKLLLPESLTKLPFPETLDNVTFPEPVEGQRNHPPKADFLYHFSLVENPA